MEKLIEIFKQVQKIPYQVCKFNEAEINLNIKQGDCRHKAHLLYKLLKENGYDVKRIKVIFNWKDLPVPKEFLDILKESGTIWDHDAVAVKVNNKYINLDCTWNPELKKKGFPITENWNGESDTKQITEGNLEFYDANKYQKKVKIIKNEALEFADKLNNWLKD
jgi:hypothetical protein